MATVAERFSLKERRPDLLSGTPRAHAIDRWIFVFTAAWYILIVLTGFIPDKLPVVRNFLVQVAAGFVSFALGTQTRIDRDKRGREHAFAEEVLQEVGDTQRAAKSVSGERVAEEVREDSVADQPGELAQQHASRYQGGRDCPQHYFLPS